MTLLDSTLDQGCFPTFLVTTESQYLTVTHKSALSATISSTVIPLLQAGPMLTVWPLSAGHVLGTARKLLLLQRSPQLFSVSWRSPSASSSLLLSMQKLQEMSLPSLSLEGIGPPFTALRPTLSLLHLGRDNSVYVPRQPHA